MTYREERYLAKEVVDMILRGMDEKEAEVYVYEQVGKNPYIFADVWDAVIYSLEYVM